MPGIVIRQLQRTELPDIWQIDRREVIQNIYYLEEGELVLKPGYFNMQGWPPGEGDLYTGILLDCFDRGGQYYGAFDGEKIVAAMVLESKFIGPQHDQLQLKFLHVSRDYRKTGLGIQLFDLAVSLALEKGAKALYISATPSENTINFYMNRGCTIAKVVDPELWALEPEDIHLVYNLK